MEHRSRTRPFIAAPGFRSPFSLRQQDDDIVGRRPLQLQGPLGGASSHCSASSFARIRTGIALLCGGSTTPLGSVVKNENSSCLPMLGAFFVQRSLAHSREIPAK